MSSVWTPQDLSQHISGVLRNIKWFGKYIFDFHFTLRLKQIVERQSLKQTEFSELLAMKKITRIFNKLKTKRATGPAELSK